MNDSSTDQPQDQPQPQPGNQSLISQMFLGAFWCVAGMFFVGPLVAFIFRILTTAGRNKTVSETLSEGFMVVTWLMLWAPGFVIMGPIGAIVGAVSYWKLRKSVTNLRLCTIGGALVADVVIAVSVVVLTLVIRS